MPTHGSVRYACAVALKPELSAARRMERFQSEIIMTANLRHPHILPLYDSGQVTGPDGAAVLYYVMPFVEGESLTPTALVWARASLAGPGAARAPTSACNPRVEPVTTPR
jgi:serine/threonine protein kinase